MGTRISVSVARGTKFSDLLLKNREISSQSHKKWLVPVSFSMLPLAVNPSDVLSWSWGVMLFQRQLKISAPYVLVKKDMDTKDPPSTELSPTSCAKAVTSPTTTELAANPSMETNSRMRTSNWGTLDPESCLWPTLDPTPTDPNFSCVPPKHHGSTENTLFSDKSSKAWMSLRRLNHLDLNRANVHKKLLLLTVANSPKKIFKFGEKSKKKNLREKRTPQNQFIQLRKNNQIPQTDFIFCVLLRSCYSKTTLR